MFDDAYLAEANLEAACIIKERAWRDLVAAQGSLSSPWFWMRTLCCCISCVFLFVCF